MKRRTPLFLFIPFITAALLAWGCGTAPTAATETTPQTETPPVDDNQSTNDTNQTDDPGTDNTDNKLHPSIIVSNGPTTFPSPSHRSFCSPTEATQTKR